MDLLIHLWTYSRRSESIDSMPALQIVGENTARAIDGRGLTVRGLPRRCDQRPVRENRSLPNEPINHNAMSYRCGGQQALESICRRDGARSAFLCATEPLHSGVD